MKEKINIHLLQGQAQELDMRVQNFLHLKGKI